MRNRSKFALLALMAAVTMLSAVSSASANRLSVNNQTFRIVWANLEFQAPSAGSTISCPVTLEGSFTSPTIVKRAGSVIGRVSRATIRGNLAAGECTGGSATIAQETLPWDITYESFGGTLPNIERITLLLLGARLAVDPLGSLPVCDMTTEVNHNARFIDNVRREAGGELKITELAADPGPSIPCIERSFFRISLEGHFAGNATATILNSASQVLIRLI
jgi:hypothetical protein